jgi:hypothetical protein
MRRLDCIRDVRAELFILHGDHVVWLSSAAYPLTEKNFDPSTVSLIDFGLRLGLLLDA